MASAQRIVEKLSHKNERKLMMEIKEINDIKFHVLGYYPFPKIYFTAANRSARKTTKIFNLMKDNFLSVNRYDITEEGLPSKCIYHLIVQEDLDFSVIPHSFIDSRLFLSKEKLTQEQIDYLEQNINKKLEAFSGFLHGKKPVDFILDRTTYDNKVVKVPKEYEMETYMIL